MPNRAFLLFSTLALLMVTSVEAKVETFTGKVIGVSDGDTISVLVNGLVMKVRLIGIDCPEKTQAFGQQAKSYTSSHAFAKTVKVVSTGRDRYKRSLGEVILPNGQNLNDLLLKNGYAWWYQKFSKDEHRQELEEKARKQKVGLWRDANASAPWDYRKKK